MQHSGSKQNGELCNCLLCSTMREQRKEYVEKHGEQAWADEQNSFLQSFGFKGSLECLRCGHIWVSNKETKPRRCAKRTCGSPYWDRPRKNKVTIAI